MRTGHLISRDLIFNAKRKKQVKPSISKVSKTISMSIPIINKKSLKTFTRQQPMMEYDLELDKVQQKIKEEKAKRVCIQLPEGLRPEAKEIVKELEQRTDAKVIIWLGSCYGACDVPLDANRLGVDLLVQWGHSEWGQ
jgi:2-(3-amino-3-carboxypropyl)histidine synthase